MEDEIQTSGEGLTQFIMFCSVIEAHCEVFQVDAIADEITLHDWHSLS